MALISIFPHRFTIKTAYSRTFAFVSYTSLQTKPQGVGYAVESLTKIQTTMKKQAIWNGKVLAESDDLVNVEGNYYFPEESLNKEYFTESSTNSVCPWKGTASYYSLTVDGKENKDAAWYYPTTKDAAKAIKGRIAFWRGVEVVDI